MNIAILQKSQSTGSYCNGKLCIYNFASACFQENGTFTCYKEKGLSLSFLEINHQTYVSDTKQQLLL